MGRGLIVLLAASLGLNLFALGHWSGRIIAGGPHPGPAIEKSHHGGLDSPFDLMRHADALSPEVRETFRAVIKGRLPSLRAEHRRMRELRRELSGLMSAEAWDGEAVAEKLDQISAAQSRQREAFHAAFVSAFETLPAAERRRLVEAAHERHGKHRRRRGSGADDRRPHHPPSDD